MDGNLHDKPVTLVYNKTKYGHRKENNIEQCACVYVMEKRGENSEHKIWNVYISLADSGNTSGCYLCITVWLYEEGVLGVEWRGVGLVLGLKGHNYNLLNINVPIPCKWPSFTGSTEVDIVNRLLGNINSRDWPSQARRDMELLYCSHC